MKYIITFLFFGTFTFALTAQPICPTVLEAEPMKLTPVVPPGGGGDENPPEGERIIYWLHGLGGLPEFWSPVATHYEIEKLINSKKPTFGNTGIENAATDLADELEDMGDAYSLANGIDRSKNFIVGQSMGNLVARTLDRRYVQVQGESNRRFGGLISFAGPHQGAQILNNADPEGPGMINEFAEAGVLSLAKGPIIEITEGLNELLHNLVDDKAKRFSFLLGPEPAITLNFIDNKLDEIETADFLYEPLQAIIGPGLDFAIPIFFSDFIAAPGPLINNADDHKVGAPFLEQLNQFETDIPMVSIYSLEIDPLLWRVISSFDDQQPHLFPKFTAVDNSWVQNAQSLIFDYKENRDNPDFNSTIQNAYGTGLSWLLNANDNWKIIIGLQYLQYSYPCTCYKYDGNGNVLYTFPANQLYADYNPFDDDSPTDCTDYQVPQGVTCFNNSGSPNLSYVQLDEGSDGVVVKSSAENLPGRLTEIEALEANHQEIRNHSETERILDGLFEFTPTFNINFFQVEDR